MYDEQFVKPMREELTKLGVVELRTPSEVDRVLSQQKGTVLVVVNSVCGCSAGACRPAVARALKNVKKPEILTTVFAGQDAEATAKARSYFTGFQPSSPSIALFKDGKVVTMIERKSIEGRSADEIAGDLVAAFNTFC